VVTIRKRFARAALVSRDGKRYKIFARVGVRNIKSFNDREKSAAEQELELPLAAKKEKSRGRRGRLRVEVDEEIVVPPRGISFPNGFLYVVI